LCLRIKVEDLDVLIATHHHIDHFGASGEIRRRSHAITHIHELEAARAARIDVMQALRSD
jgi:glyoxylase-like metal-dependent hydrolase (beta-lactamase superfamily II)